MQMQKTAHFQKFGKKLKLIFAYIYHSPLDSYSVLNIEAPNTVNMDQYKN